MRETEQKAIKYIEEKELISAGDKVLVALSGGPDSVFLLSFFNKFSRKYRITLGAFHLNHMLRRKANPDEEFCRNLCSSMNIPFFSEKINIKKRASDKKISVEEAGRNARYELLEKTASENGYSKIATGHNLDDNTETVLLNLFKGTGIRGISGIPYRRGNIIRPLLGIQKSELLEYLDQAGIPFIIDKSNLNNDYERNFIRNRVLPLVRKRLNPSVDEAILRSSDTFKEYSSFIERKTIQAEEYALEKGKDIKLNLRRFHIIDKELKGGLLKNIIEKNFNTVLTFKDIRSLLELSEKETGKSILLRDNLRIFRDREHLVISDEKKQQKKEWKVKRGEKVEIDGKTFSIEEWRGKPEFSDDKNREFIDGDKSGDEFVLRQWKNGDKFKPIGMQGTVKVSDFLNSVKIPSSEKKKKLVLTDKKEIIWVIGCRISDNYKITKNTRRILKICLM